MNFRSIIKWSVLGCMLLCIAFLGPRVRAEESDFDETTGEAISPNEALRRGAMELWAAEQAGEKVREYLSAARKTKDIIRINCVQEKLAQINTVIGLARKELKELRSVAPTDETGDKSRILYEKMAIFKEQAENIRREAEGCSGEELTYTGETKVTVDIDPSIPVEDPTEPPAGLSGSAVVVDEVIIGRPPEVSPYF